MRTDRLFQIVYLLLEKKTLTAKELAARLEVSVRTVLRDIDTLSSAGIPVYSTRGKGGGISILDGFVLSSAALSEDEQNQVLLALQALSATGHPDAKDTISKLGALFKKSGTEWIEVDFSRWGQGERDNRRFELLKSAVLKRQAIVFDYVSSYGERSRRKVYPLKLLFKSRSWYLQGFCLERQAYRTFRITRMLELCMLDEQFPAAHYAPPPADSAAEASAAYITLELEFPPQLAYRAYDEFDEGCIEVSDGGDLYVRVSLPEDNWLYSFLLSLGSEVKVLAPRHVAEALKEKIKRI